MPVAQLAKFIADAGFVCTQLAPAKAIQNVDKIADITPVLLDEIREAFAREGVEISVLGCYIEPSITDRDKRLENVALFRENLRHAAALGVPIVGTETTHFPIDAPAHEREIVYKLLLDSVLRMVEKAEQVGVCVGIEPVAEHTLNSPTLARRLLDDVQSDKLKIVFDPVNLLLPATFHEQARIFAETFSLLGEEIAAVHVKDVVIAGGEKVWRNIGAGGVDYGLIIPWLRAHKPGISLLREGVNPDSYALCRDAMKHMLTL
jgi:sugar phosphate isomerase/epimerase